MRNFLRLLLTIGLSVLILACGGGGGGSSSAASVAPVAVTPLVPSGDNVQAISVNGGPTGTVNVVYTSVTICVPGSTQCQTIDNVIVDTGSVGLRVLSSALNGLPLPQQQLVAGHSLAECVSFLDGSYLWGPVQIADVKIAGKTAASLPIHVVAENSVGTPPSTCQKNSNPSVPAVEIIDVQTFGGNAILGVGPLREDCGAVICAVTQNDYYYDCSTSVGCIETAADTTRQVQNPIGLFSSDNNGVIIQLPEIENRGTTRVDGWMIFGIDTRANNALGSAKVFTLSGGIYLNTNYKGTRYFQSFIDSGSNGLFFPDATIAKCSSTDELSFYCPASTLSLSAIIGDENGTNAAVNFSVANTRTLNGSFNAFNNLAGYYSDGFDWGLPFFFGRKVYTSLETNPEASYIAF